MNFLKGTWLLAVSAVACAAATYFFIHGEIQQKETREKEQDPSYKLIKLTAKNISVNPRLASSAPDGYQILMDKVTVNPQRVLVIGPEALLEEASTVETALIDVSESTKTVSRRIPIESVAGVHLTGESYIVDVTVPIEKVEATKE